MTKRQAAISVICTYNWCFDGCPMFRSCEFKCLAQGAADAELIRIAHKRILADIARRRYEKREKTPRLQEWMQIINKAFPRGAKVV